MKLKYMCNIQHLHAHIVVWLLTSKKLLLPMTIIFC